MDTSFILSCESTIDLPYSYCEAREIPVLFYSYQVDGVDYLIMKQNDILAII
mgnify:CR=1 FL=1